MSFPPDLDPLVELKAFVPDVLLDLRYARRDNAFETVFYPSAAAWLRRSAALKVATAAGLLRRKGLRLIVYDAYRPVSVQRRMWEMRPDPRFVADPYHGSLHNRGAALDCGLADAEGRPVEMPSQFDDFSARASHHSPFATSGQRRHAAWLREAMEAAGLCALSEEWWHYFDPHLRDAPLVDLPFAEL